MRAAPASAAARTRAKESVSRGSGVIAAVARAVAAAAVKVAPALAMVAMAARSQAAMSGLGTNTLGNWEGAQRRPRIDQLAMVLPILEVTADWVYFADDRALAWHVREAIMRELAALAPPSGAVSRGAA